MKKRVDIEMANRLINCGMVVLISCAYKDKQNITTCAWHMPLSKRPPAIAIALAKKHFSSELIKKSEEFIINIPNWVLLNKVITCGTLKGRSIDKFKEAELTAHKANALARTHIISECIGHIECSLFDIKEVGDHFLFLGEVVYAEAEEDYFKEGYWDTNKVHFILHLGSNYFFKSSPFSEFRK